MKETNKTGTRFISCVLAVMMVVTTLTGIFPATVSASSQSGVGSEMWSNVYLDALAYTGYPVQTQRDNGDLFDKCAAAALRAGYSSDIPGNYDYVLSSTVATGVETTSAGLPDLNYFEAHGFQCGSYVSYVLYNYLPNVVGFDVEEEWGWTRPAGYVSPNYYLAAAKSWIAAGNATAYTGTANGTNVYSNITSDVVFSQTFVSSTAGYTFTLDAGVEIPIGSLIFMNHVDSNGNVDSSPAHVCLYAGYYNGYHYITHTGNARGPEINRFDYMSIAESELGKADGYAEVVTLIVMPIIEEEEYGKIVVNKTDENGSGLSGAVFTATNKSTGDTYTIGPTDSSGAAENKLIPYGTYTVTETTMPSGYTVKDDGDPWTVTVSSSTPTVTINASNTGTKSLVILKQDEDGGQITTAKFTLTSTSYSGYSKTVTTSGTRASAQFTSIPYGTYKLTESYVPDGYEASSEDPWTITVSSTGVTIKSSSGSTVASTTSSTLTYTVTNTSIYGSIAVYKTAAEDGSNLSGAYFTATNKSTGDTYSIGPTNSSGYAINSEIPYGTYTVTETTMPSGYTEKDADDPWTVTLTRAATVATIRATDTSNALEGNTLTLSETKVLIEDGITVGGKPLRDCIEAVGHADAYDYMVSVARSDALDISEDTILYLHELFYSGIDAKNAGKYRDIQVFITVTVYVLPKPEEVPKLMSDFIRDLKAVEKELHPIVLAAFAHEKLVKIHPFVDGNGRTSRFLMNLILLNKGYAAVSIPPVLRFEYIQALQAAQRSENPDSEPLVKLIAECEIEAQKDYFRLSHEPIPKFAEKELDD